MITIKHKPVGLTKDVGFEVGARKTFPVSIEDAWNFLVSKKGIKIWLGQITPDKLIIGKTFQTTEGTEVKLKVLKPYSHLRMKWKPKNWENNSTLQIRVIPAKTKTIISFHQELMDNEDQRTEMKIHWNNILDEFTIHLKK